VVIATGAASVLAGGNLSGASSIIESDGVGGAARLGIPRGVVYDGAGNLYVATSSATLRKIVISTRTVSTVAGLAFTSALVDGIGTGARINFGFQGSLDNQGNVWFGDSSAVRKFYPSAGALVTAAGSATTGSADGPGASATFTNVGGAAFDNSNGFAIYVTDWNNNLVRRLQ
jgi:hypothetical protein